MKIVKSWDDSKIQLEFDIQELIYISSGVGLLRQFEGWDEDMFVLSHNLDSVGNHGRVYTKEELKESIATEFS